MDVASIEDLFKSMKLLESPPRSPEGLSVLTFDSGKKLLGFIGGTHKPCTEQEISAIRQLFESVNPNKVLLEMPKDQDKREVIESARNLEKRHWNEFYNTIEICLERNIDFSFVDLSYGENLSFFLGAAEDGFEIYLLELFSVIYTTLVNTYFHERSFKIDDYFGFALSQLAMDILEKESLSREFAKRYQIDSGGIVTIVKDIIEKTAEKYLYPDKLTPDLIMSKSITAPFPFSKKYAINEINALHEATRDHAMLNEMLKSLDEKDRIIMVGGKSHMVLMKEFIVKAMSEHFGSCKVYP